MCCLCAGGVPEGRTVQQGACRDCWGWAGVPRDLACLRWQLPGYGHRQQEPPESRGWLLKPRLQRQSVPVMYLEAEDAFGAHS